MISAQSVSRRLRVEGIVVQSNPLRQGIRVKRSLGCVAVVCDFDSERDSLRTTDALEEIMRDMGFTVERVTPNILHVTDEHNHEEEHTMFYVVITESANFDHEQHTSRTFETEAQAIKAAQDAIRIGYIQADVYDTFDDGRVLISFGSDNHRPFVTGDYRR